ncbi:hypothetical protein [Bacteroides caccae]|uniref:hypothetical protein n=1 Tax=Bacteroides caccae TaxID=47678 RepID=UPI0022AA1DEA|nr:hypothetical protein [Bacteroides caccae]MCZ2726242.1 hypothetical protein [Bacteroides caccae]
MAKKEVEERELTGKETAAAITIMLISLVVLGDITELWRVIIAFMMLVGDLVLVYQAKYSIKKGG